MAEADGGGLLLNLAVADNAISRKTTFKGGRWKDRLRAVRGARHRERKSAAVKKAHNQAEAEEQLPSQTLTSNLNHDHPRQAPPRAAKRRRIQDKDESTENKVDHSAGIDAAHTKHKHTTLGPRQVVSSLFTANPKTTMPKQAASYDTTQPEPSNAPLADDTTSFGVLGLSQTVALHLQTKLGLTMPTGIQEAVIPQLLKDDSDAFIQAETGSGKTLAYLLPIIQRIIHGFGSSSPTEAKDQDAAAQMHRDSGLFAIILAPTRELCRQISAVLETVLRCAHWIVAGTVVGGEKKKSEKARIRKGLNILVATPGRLVDHLQHTEVLDVSNVRWLVLDEGDRLMELGFEEEIKTIVTKLQERSQMSGRLSRSSGALPRRRVTILCSATMRMNVQRLGEISLQDAVHLQSDPTKADGAEKGERGDASGLAVFSAPAQLKQSFVVVSSKLRLVTLTAVLRRAFIRRGSVMKAIVFITCADSVDFHYELFTRPLKAGTGEAGKPADAAAAAAAAATATAVVNQGIFAPAATLSTADSPVTMYKLHGSLPQPVRTATLKGFARSTAASVLVCTDVASRGLDLPHVDFVIEYDPAFSKDDHLHRIGRTARAGRPGRTLIFLLPGGEEGYVELLKAARRGGAKGLVQEEAEALLRRGFGSSGLGAGQDWEAKATEWQLDVERWLLAHAPSLALARRAFQSHIRAYATHVVAERAFFDIKNLHLGHAAKAFGLRDRPASINVPGMRGATRRDVAKGAGARTRDGDGDGDGDRDVLEGTGLGTGPGTARRNEALHAAAQKMHRAMKEHMNGIAEFNLG
ncbi:MAG: ATP-dependent RNA helicase dbp7 [Phylliscum demangeonii]|nr:MAG: ATP-dependent RNA helicase dbp7 [Phylliscum demangeonii]